MSTLKHIPQIIYTIGKCAYSSVLACRRRDVLSPVRKLLKEETEMECIMSSISEMLNTKLSDQLESLLNEKINGLEKSLRRE